MTTYIKFTTEGDTCFNDMTGKSLDTVLFTASHMIAFSDCTDIEVLEIVHEGKRYEYSGWEPGMVFTFCDESGKDVWQRDFPSWDH